jgi:excisionase family DNA binding protein
VSPVPSPHSDPLLTADEVAELLRVTRAWVYSETRARRIPHVRLGRYVRYRRSAVEAWVAEIEAPSTSQSAVRSIRRWPSG